MKNAWLSMTIPDDHRTFLFSLAKFLETKFETMNQKFNIMKKDDLHMTSVFLGKQYKQKDHDKIFEIVSRFNFHHTRHHTLHHTQHHMMFKIKSITLFPPTKNNLIIIKYDIDKTFHDELKKLKATLRTELSYIIDGDNVDDNEDDFIPHVTLGKLSLTKDEIKDLVSSGRLEKFYEEFQQSNIDNLIVDFAIDENLPMYMSGSDV